MTLHELQDTAGGRLEIERVDINAPEQVQALRDRLGARKFDLLFINAGIPTTRTRPPPTSQPRSTPA